MQVNRLDQTAKYELEDTYSHKEDHNRTMVVHNTITKCNSKCLTKIIHLMEDNNSQAMGWTRCQARLEVLWFRTTQTITQESRTQELLLLHFLILLSWLEEKETLLVLLNSNFPAIRICKDLMGAMLINFISSNCSNKCRNSHCIISQLEDLPMAQVQVMETMPKVSITSMETSSMGTKTKTIKHQTKM